MPDDAPLSDPRDDESYSRYLVTCAALGVKPVGIERARQLVPEWTAIFEAVPKKGQLPTHGRARPYRPVAAGSRRR